MPFEQNGVMWVINFSNPSTKDVTITIDFKLTAMVSKFSTVCLALRCAEALSVSTLRIRLQAELCPFLKA